MQYDLTTKEDRLGWFIGKYKKIYLAVFAVWFPLIVLMSVVTVLEWQKVASINFKIAHSFVPVH